MGHKYVQRYFVDIDNNGKPQTGSIVIAYPTGTMLNGTTGSPAGIAYKVTISCSDDAKVCSHYDVYINSVLKQEHISFGEWRWKSNCQVILQAGNTFLFQNMTDENGNDLPDVIQGAIIIPLPVKDRQFYVKNLTTIQFELVPSTLGEDDIPITVPVLIMINETF